MSKEEIAIDFKVKASPGRCALQITTDGPTWSDCTAEQNADGTITRILPMPPQLMARVAGNMSAAASDALAMALKAQAEATKQPTLILPNN